MTVTGRVQWFYLVPHRWQVVTLAGGKLYHVVSTFDPHISGRWLSGSVWPLCALKWLSPSEMLRYAFIVNSKIEIVKCNK